MTLVLASDTLLDTPAAARPIAAPKRTTTRPKRRRRLAVLAAALLASVAGGGWWYTQQAEAELPLSTVTAARGDVEQTVLATGTLEASSLVSVGAQVSGIVKSVNVELGDTVKAGDVIAEIDSLNQENALKAAQAALASATAQRAAEAANLDKVQKALDRADQLGIGDLISQSDYDIAATAVASSEAQLQVLDAQIQQATLNVQSAQLNLDRTSISAPADGTVVAVLVDQGQTVNASQTAPTIVKIADLDTMKIKAEISEADVAKVKAGQAVKFSLLGDPTAIAATLTSIDPAPASIATDDSGSSDAAIYYDATFEVPNPTHALRIGMTAKVTVVLAAADNVVTLPASALGTAGRDGSYTVDVLDPATGKAVPHTVTVGLNDKVSAEIISGLTEGDAVVTGKTASAALPAAATSATGTRAPMGPMGL